MMGTDIDGIGRVVLGAVGGAGTMGGEGGMTSGDAATVGEIDDGSG